ncbi:MAG: adenylyltransferase/cytidyltransferase family protein [Paracoccaceae bacterium]
MLKQGCETALEREAESGKPFGTILTYGTFDLFHIGHVRLLKRLSALGERLIVGCSTDGFNAIKGKAAIMPYEDRAEILRACEFVTEVIPEEGWDQKRKDIVRHGVDLFAMGDDWAGRFDELSDLCRVLYLPRTEDISTTQLKAAVAERALARADLAAE